jgi:hypothetical protein
MKTPRRTFLHLATGTAALPVLSRVWRRPIRRGRFGSSSAFRRAVQPIPPRGCSANRFWSVLVNRS